MDKFKGTLERIFNNGPELNDFLIVFGLIITGIVVALGSIISFFVAFGYLLIGLFELSLIKLFLGLVWCVILAFFVAIVIVALKLFGDIVG